MLLLTHLLPEILEAIFEHLYHDIVRDAEIDDEASYGRLRYITVSKQLVRDWLCYYTGVAGDASNRYR